MPELQVAIRYLVFAAFAASVLVALASWLVRTRRVSPFGALGRTLRTTSEPLIRPIETRLVRAGGNRSEEHTSELQSLAYLVCRLLLEKKKKKKKQQSDAAQSTNKERLAIT